MRDEVFAAGVDVGSTQTKAVVMDGGRRIRGRALIPTGANVTGAARRAFEEACRDAHVLPQAVRVVAGTGYGRYKVTFGDLPVTEISCHARGAQFYFPEVRTVIDIGGQDTKAIRVGADGMVADFAMNDKCAAGTGRFLAAAAEVIGVSLDELGPLSMRARDPVRLTSVCTVFVESDIMGYLAEGKTPEDILAGVHRAIAVRTMALVRRIGAEPEFAMTGGVARNAGMVRALEERLGAPLRVAPDAHFMGAIGAALFAIERAEARVAPQEASLPDLRQWEAP
jgi:predicted CoA-substrate-specific enzyme activase